MSKKLKLTDREWKDFLLTEFFCPIKGNQNNMSSLLSGRQPLISAKKENNGLKGFITPNERASFQPHCITLNLDGDGGAGLAFFHEYSFALDSHVVALYPKRDLSRWILLFIVRSLSSQKSRFGHGRAIKISRVYHFPLMLPTTSNGTPDWVFMEAYMRQVEEELLAEALPKLEQQLLDNIVTLGALDDREWKEFKFEDVFNIVDGYYNKKPPMVDNGTLPFLGATQYNNGVTGMTTSNSVRVHDKVGGDSINDVEKRFYVGGCIAITNNGSVGHAYYQASKFTCSHDITVVYLKDQVMAKELATFLIPSVQKAGESFAYAKKWRPIRMKRSKLMLPIQVDGTPDWEFMSAFMKRVEQETLLPALRHFKNKKCNQMLRGGG